MSDTTNLLLPYLAPGQAQKHVTVNESLRRLDAIVQLSVVSATTTAEPGSPADGAVYILPAGKTGTHWGGFANGALAYYRDGAWVEIAPREGWLAFVKDADVLLFHSGSAWAAFPVAKLISVSATDKVLGRSSSGAGPAEEIACTAAGRALIDDADAAAQRTTLGLGSAATHADSDYVHTTGSETIAGSKTISSFWTFNGTNVMTQNEAFRIQHNGGYISFANASNTRMGYLQFSNGGAVTLINEQSGQNIVLNCSGAVYAGGGVRPLADNTSGAGSASFRFSEVFAANATINTSDACEKTRLEPVPEAAKRAVRRILEGVGVFQWLSSVDAKGEDARLHVGVTAQDVAAAFEAEGLDPSRFGLYCEDAVEELIEVVDVVEAMRPTVRKVRKEKVEIENGQPVLREAEEDEEVAELKPLRDAEGRAVTRDGAPVLVRTPVMETVQEQVKRLERRAVMGADGNPAVRRGVRYEQLLLLALAAQA